VEPAAGSELPVPPLLAEAVDAVWANAFCAKSNQATIDDATPTMRTMRVLGLQAKVIGLI